MDRLSAYAQRESETESPEQRQKTEEESIAKLLEQLRIAKENNRPEQEEPPTEANGGAPEEAQAGAEESNASSTTDTGTEAESKEEEGEAEKRRGIPGNIKLFEIFHEQVATLVKMQRLAIQDTVGLLVSLANLAL